MAQKFVYRFQDDIGGRDARELLGGKGSGLREMVKLGIPVPPGFTISTEACRAWNEGGRKLPPEAVPEVESGIAAVEKALGRTFGGGTLPLLVSVRSGAAASMPGMMDTILNLGLNDETVEALAKESGNRRFAFDAFRRLLQMFGDVVMGVPREHFEKALANEKRALGNPVMLDSEVPAEALERVCAEAKRIIQTHAGRPFPADVREQLWAAVDAVFASWENPRARRYRQMHDIRGLIGTAVNVQAMVFGNLGDDSGSGVAFTRNPSNGEKVLYGEFLHNAQGEDVVAGIRTPKPITKFGSARGRDHESLEATMPAAFASIVEIAGRLETHFRDMQDIEFTVERGKVFLLQTRNAKRTAHAAVRVAVDLVREGRITEDEAIMRVEAPSLEQLLHASLPSPDTLKKRGIEPIATGIPASPGAAIGIIVLDADEAESLAAQGKEVILVRRETSPEDIHGMKAAQGIITATGGMTSHAAVVARGLGKCCVAGCSGLNVDYETRTVTARDIVGRVTVLRPGDRISLDGTNGAIYSGELEVEAAAKVPDFDVLMAWADARRGLKVRTNADTARQARTARAFGAEGIGLCRTEHMFFAEDRVEAVRCMALSQTPEDRAKWLERIEPMQQGDFEEIFTAMDGLPVTIRLLDWPLHEFLPKEAREFASVAKALGVAEHDVRSRALDLHEVNPMLGHRGVRLGITDPAVYRMQARAILRAAARAQKKGVRVLPEIMIPVVALASELAILRSEIDAIAKAVFEEETVTVAFQFGTMIELPRACLVAGDLAKDAEFFSFGTNDLTQTTFGISRDDAGKFLAAYLGHVPPVFESDPFARLDETGVGELIAIAVERGKKARPTIKLGICGEHGGEPHSIAFAARVGLDYVSCSPPRLPIARLAAAQAALRSKGARGGSGTA
jgi:pyruvate,orthophosphate dikinase